MSADADYEGVSFCVVTHDRPSLLRDLIEDLREEVLLLRGRAEIIIHDDASTDPDAIDLLSRLGADGDVTVVRKDHAFEVPESWAHHINLAFTRARYDVVVHLDDDVSVDCDCEPSWARHMAGYLRSDRGIGVLCPKKPGFFEPAVEREGDLDACAFPGISEPCFAMRRETFPRLGPFDTALRWLYGPDYALRTIQAGLACAFDQHCLQTDLCPETGLTAARYRPEEIPFGRKLRDKWGTILDREEFWPYRGL